MSDPVFLDSAAFLRVWQRVTGEAGHHSSARAAGAGRNHSAAARVYMRKGCRRCLLCRTRAARVRRPAAARTDRSAGARAAQSAANRVFSAHGRALCPARRLSAAEHGGGGSALCLFAGACAQRAAGRGSGCCADAAQGNAAHYGAAGCAPRTARAHAAHRTDFLREMRAKCESFKLALDFTGNFDYNMQADNLK